MGITSGCKNEDDGGNWNMQLVANMMCEICGFDLPFPEIFYDEDLLQPPQPNLDHSAVGDFADPEHAAHHQSAVGDSADPEDAAQHQSASGNSAGPEHAAQDQSTDGNCSNQEHTTHHQSAVGDSAAPEHTTHHQSGLGDHTEELAPAAGQVGEPAKLEFDAKNG